MPIGAMDWETAVHSLGKLGPGSYTSPRLSESSLGYSYHNREAGYKCGVKTSPKIDNNRAKGFDMPYH